MLVFDLVKIVDRGALTSCLPGRWLVDHFADEAIARNHAARYNNARGAFHVGFRYEVEAHDELSRLRAISYGDFAYACHLTGQNPQKIAGTPLAELLIERVIADNL